MLLLPKRRYITMGVTMLVVRLIRLAIYFFFFTDIQLVIKELFAAFFSIKLQKRQIV